MCYIVWRLDDDVKSPLYFKRRRLIEESEIGKYMKNEQTKTVSIGFEPVRGRLDGFRTQFLKPYDTITLSVLYLNHTNENLRYILWLNISVRTEWYPANKSWPFDDIPPYSHTPPNK